MASLEWLSTMAKLDRTRFTPTNGADSSVKKTYRATSSVMAPLLVRMPLKKPHSGSRHQQSRPPSSVRSSDRVNTPSACRRFRRPSRIPAAAGAPEERTKPVSSATSTKLSPRPAAATASAPKRAPISIKSTTGTR